MLDFLAQRVFHTRLPASVGDALVTIVGESSLTQRRGRPGFLESCNEAPGSAIRATQAEACSPTWGAGGDDRWYALAHSQGTVVALNGLTASAPALTADLDNSAPGAT